ncbi:MAG: flagellar biosynthetic protein FliQ [Acidobacteriia bacterium]|nr:flagellar biosynthetic protein FliQ [Terriglobia bacterium]
MEMAQVIQLFRQTLEAALWVGAPILLITTAVSLVISIVQVMTSIQDATVSTTPRLMIVAISILLLTPWMLRRLMQFTEQLFSNLHLYAR